MSFNEIFDATAGVYFNPCNTRLIMVILRVPRAWDCHRVNFCMVSLPAFGFNMDFFISV